jgi:hypothetical protein
MGFKNDVVVCTCAGSLALDIIILAARVLLRSH